MEDSTQTIGLPNLTFHSVRVLDVSCFILFYFFKEVWFLFIFVGRGFVCLFVLIFVFCFPEILFHYIALAALELTM